jgi:hypothetical protein
MVMQNGRSWVARVSVGSMAVAMAFAAAACSDSNDTTPLVATTVTANTGANQQVGIVGQALADTLSVHVADQDGNAMPNAVVGWTVVSGSGSASATTSTTDVNGNATTVWTLGTKAGLDSMTVAVANGPSLVLTATAGASAFASLAKVTGDSQTVVSGSTTQPFVVMATDQFGNPVANATVIWSVVGGGVLSVVSSTTDATGATQATLATAATPGTYVVTAVSGSATVTFNVTGS